MILRRIVEFAERQTTALPSGYQRRFVTKVIELDPTGRLINIVPLSGDLQGKRHGMRRPEPQESPMRTVAVIPRLFADNVNYVLGRAREKDKPEQIKKRHQAWIDLVNEAGSALPDVPEVQAVVAWIATDGPGICREDERIELDDEITISVNGRFVTDIPEVRRFWATRGDQSQQGLCLVTGQVTSVVDRMPAPIKGVPDGQMSGTALISVNNAAGESYGLEAALNSPISTDAAEKICNGLNDLLNTEAGIDEKGRRKYQHSLRVGKTVFVAWSRELTNRNLLDDLDSPDPAHVQSLIELVSKGGRKAYFPEPSDFFVLSLSANAARIVVRDYHETTLARVEENLGRWFQRLQMMSLDGDSTKPVGIYRLAASLYRDANKEMPAHVPTALMTAALSGRLIPDYILGLAVKRNLAMQGPYAEFNRQRYLSMERLALIKAILEQKENLNLSALNPNHPDSAYHCGRLLAVLEQIQRSALGDINATIVDRYYGAACSSPGTILGNLVNDSQSHLAKLRKGAGDGWAQNKLAEVLEAIGDEFPKTLPLTRQGLFALGFYHQKAHDRAAAIEAKAAKLAQAGDNAQ